MAAESPGTAKRLFRWSSKRKLTSREDGKGEFDELLGRGLCAEGRRAHRSREAVEARRALRDWLTNAHWTHAAARANDPMMIRFPERFVLTEETSEDSFECVVKGASNTRCGPRTTVSELLARCCNSEECFVLKVVGRLQFLLRNEWRLADYEYVSLRRRTNKPILLDLVKIDEETRKSLAVVRFMSKKDAARIAEEAKAPRGDVRQLVKANSRPLLEERSSFLRAADEDEDDFEAFDREDISGQQNLLSLSAVPVPLSVTVKRFRMGALTPYRDTVRVRASSSKRRWTRFEQLGHVAKWNPGESLEICSDARNEPRSSRLLLEVFGDDDEQVPLARVCVSLFDRAGPSPSVRRGECQLRMWPPSLSSVVVGENAVDDFGVLTIVFEACDDFVADDGPNLNDAVEAAEAQLVVGSILGHDYSKRYTAFRSDTYTVDEREEDSSDDEEPLTTFENQAELDAAVELARARSAELDEFLPRQSRGSSRRSSKAGGVSQVVESVFKSLVSGSSKKEDSLSGQPRSRRPSDTGAYRKVTRDNQKTLDEINNGSPANSSSGDLSPANATTRRTFEDSPSSFGEDDSLLPSHHQRSRRPSAQMRAAIERIATRQKPLVPLTQEDAEALWGEREYASRFPGLLPKWWLAVPKYDRSKLREARVLMARWARDDRPSIAKPNRSRPSSWSSGGDDYAYRGALSSSSDSSSSKIVANDALSTHARVALELLGHDYTDSVVREYACRRLDEMTDGHLANLVLQLVQALKVEPGHDSPLARLLIRRGACSPLNIGHKLFWGLRAEMHDPCVCERFGVVLYGLLSAFGSETRELLWSECVVDRILSGVASKVKAESLKSARGRARECLRQADRELKRHVERRKQRLLLRIAHEREEHPFLQTMPEDPLSPSDTPPSSSPPPPPPPPNFHAHSPPRSASHSAKKHLVSSLTTFSSAFSGADFRNSGNSSMVALCCGFSTCLDPTWRCKGIDVSKCRVLSSKKQPLHVVLKNSDHAAGGSDDLHVIYKHGDDLRQDQLTLQLVRLMDDMWRRQGLDLLMCPYRCVASGDNRGMIEVVRNARTTADIQVEFGRGARGAFKDNVVSLYLEAHNPDSRSFERARSTFVSTCSGYCVATHVLGVGDRHADNIMVEENGRLFHIDFGHFLGNFKDKFGIKRERSPFVFTPDMKNVMSALAPEKQVASANRFRKFFSGSSSSKTSSAAGRRRRQQERYGSSSSRDEEDPQRHLGYEDFENFCCGAYNAVRDRAESFVVLFTLMLPAGMPELMEPDDVAYMIDQLALDLSPAKAAEKFRGDINNAHRDIWRRVDNYLHNKKHNAPKAQAAAGNDVQGGVVNPPLASSSNPPRSTTN